jgi:hypothetical protein
MNQREWQEVFSIVLKHQRSLFNTFNNKDKEEYYKLNEILTKLEPYAYGEQNAKSS